MNPGKNAVPDISPQILPAGTHHLGAARFGRIHEQRNDRFCDKLHENLHEDAEAGGEHYGIPERFYGTLRLFCADILRSERRNGGEHGGGDEKEKTDDLFDDANRRRIVQSPVIGNDGDHDESHLDQTVLKGDRHADLQNFSHDRTAGLEIAFLGRDAGLSFFHYDKGDDYSDCLGKRGSESGAGRSHVKQTDEQVIQSDIGDARHGDEVHRAFGIAHAPEYRADDVIYAVMKGIPIKQMVR